MQSHLSVRASDHGVLEVLKSCVTEKEESVTLDRAKQKGPALVVIDQITKFRKLPPSTREFLPMQLMWPFPAHMCMNVLNSNYSLKIQNYDLFCTQ
jgi:hypothetical protein